MTVPCLCQVFQNIPHMHFPWLDGDQYNRICFLDECIICVHVSVSFFLHNMFNVFWSHYLFKWKISNCEVVVIDGFSVASVNFLQLQCVWIICNLHEHLYMVWCISIQQQYISLYCWRKLCSTQVPRLRVSLWECGLIVMIFSEQSMVNLLSVVCTSWSLIRF